MAQHAAPEDAAESGDAESEPAPPAVSPEAKRLGRIIVFSIAGVLALAIILSSAFGSGDSSGDDPENRAAGAYLACEGFVSSSLKAPSTAEFEGYSPAAISSAGNRYTVRSYVDAQNSFGAMIRTDFTCVVELRAERFYLDSLTGF